MHISNLRKAKKSFPKELYKLKSDIYKLILK